MDPTYLGIIGVVGLLILLAIGIHVSVALAIVGVFGATILTGFNSAVWQLTTTMYYQVADITLIVIPLFIFMGLLASAGGVSRDLFTTLSAWLGRMRAGLGIATVLACTAFGAVCGSSLATSIVFTKVCAPEMRRHGYSKWLAYGITSSGGSIGMLIPPSVLAVVYGLLTGESVGKLLIAGIIPGILLAVAFSAVIWITSIVNPKSVGGSGIAMETFSCRQRITGVKAFWPIVLVAGIIFGGLFGGVFSPSEAAAVASLVMLIIVLSRGGRWRAIREGVAESAALGAEVFFIFGGAMIFGRFLLLTGISQELLTTVVSWNLSGIEWVLIMSVVYLVLGCFLSAIAMLAVTIPITYPIILATGIDPIWYAMVVIVNTQVGGLTPPVGLLVYAAKGVAEPDVGLEEIFKGSMPFFFTMLATLGLLIAFPPLSTWLPSLMMGN